MIEKIKKVIKKHSLKGLLTILDFRYGLGRIESILFGNWFNPFATLWLNFRSFPIKQALKFPVWCYGRPRFYGLSGEMQIEGKVFSGMIRFNQVKPGAPSNMSVQSEIINHGLIIFRGQGLIGTGNKIVVAYNAVLDIGGNFKITDMCNIGCFREIRIGEQSRIVHRCQVFDSNYHYVANFVHRIVPNCIRPVHIGKGCWVCNSTTITGGAILPNYTIVGSNSLVNKDFSNIPESSMIGGVPAKFLATGFRKVENCAKKHEINLYYYNNPQKTYVIPELDTCDEYSFIDRFE